MRHRFPGLLGRFGGIVAADADRLFRGLIGARPPERTGGGKRFGGPGGKIEFWILNAERALASLEETGAAQTGMAGGNWK